MTKNEPKPINPYAAPTIEYDAKYTGQTLVIKATWSVKICLSLMFVLVLSVGLQLVSISLAERLSILMLIPIAGGLALIVLAALLVGLGWVRETYSPAGIRLSQFSRKIIRWDEVESWSSVRFEHQIKVVLTDGSIRRLNNLGRFENKRLIVAYLKRWTKVGS